jgi:paraquat-inducible protein B
MVVGVFVLGAAALALGAVLVFGSARFFRHEVTLVSYFSGSVNGLVVGSPVKFRGVPIGSVSQIRLGLPGASAADVRIPVWFIVDLDTISGYQGRRFRLDRQRLDVLIAAGFRAQLQTESFVTGVLFLGLDFFPDSPVVLALTGKPEVLEVPVMPTTIERAIQTLDRLVNRVEALDLKGLVASARHALDGVDDLARSPKVADALDGLRDALASIHRVTAALEPGVTPTIKGLDATLAQAREVLIRVEPQLDQTLAHAQELLGPDAPLAVGLASTLADLGEAARSVRDLADFLDRHPNAILTGRPKP